MIQETPLRVNFSLLVLEVLTGKKWFFKFQDKTGNELTRSTKRRQKIVVVIQYVVATQKAGTTKYRQKVVVFTQYVTPKVVVDIKYNTFLIQVNKFWLILFWEPKWRVPKVVF